MDERGRRTWIIVTIIVLILIGSFVAVVLGDRGQQAASQPPEGVQTFENLSREHTQDPVAYEQTPPVGGITTQCGKTAASMNRRSATRTPFTPWSMARSGSPTNPICLPIRLNCRGIWHTTILTCW